MTAVAFAFEVGEAGDDAVEFVLPVPPHAVSNKSINAKVATKVKQIFCVDSATLIVRYTPFLLGSIQTLIANKLGYKV